MRHRRPALLLCLLAPLAGCGGDAPMPDMLVRDVAHSASAAFSGRVPDLDARDLPGDTLALERTFGDSLSFARISGLAVVGDRLLATDRMMSEHVAVVDLRSGEVERHFGRHGEGPGEFRDPAWAFAAPGPAPEAWVYDFQNRRFARIRLDAEPGSEVREEVRLNVDASLESPVWTRDGIISNGVFPDYTFLVLSRTGTPRARLAAEPPFTERHVPDWNGRRLLNRSFMAVDGAAERIALAYQFAPRIDFFTIDGARYGSVEGPRRTTPRWRMRDGRFTWEDANEMAYWSVRATDRYVYALFCGCRLDEQRLPDRVHVFRWNGDLVGELALDRPVMALAVSADDERLYGAIEEPYPTIGEWTLPAELRGAAAPSAGGDDEAR